MNINLKSATSKKRRSIHGVPHDASYIDNSINRSMILDGNQVVVAVAHQVASWPVHHRADRAVSEAIWRVRVTRHCQRQRLCDAGSHTHTVDGRRKTTKCIMGTRTKCLVEIALARVPQKWTKMDSYFAPGAAEEWTRLAGADWPQNAGRMDTKWRRGDRIHIARPRVRIASVTQQSNYSSTAAAAAHCAARHETPTAAGQTPRRQDAQLQLSQ